MAIGLDGQDGGNVATTSASPVASGVSGLTTTHANDILVVLAMASNSLNHGISVGSITDSNSLSWTSRSTNFPTFGGQPVAMEVWWAPAAGIQSGNTVQVQWSESGSGGTNVCGFAVFGVSGAASLVTPFDGNLSLPATASIGASAAPTVNFSTTAVNTFVFAMCYNGGGTTGHNGSGYTALTQAVNLNSGDAEYQVFSGAQTNTPANFTSADGTSNGSFIIADAIALIIPYLQSHNNALPVRRSYLRR